MSTVSSAPLETLEEHMDWLLEIYRDFHRHPELSLREHRTAARIVEELRAIETATGAAEHPEGGFELTTGLGLTGVVAVLRRGTGPTVLLRADIDGLPVREETGLDWASRDTGVPYRQEAPHHADDVGADQLSDTDQLPGGDSDQHTGEQLPVMHACGHDTHIVCLLGTLRMLLESAQQAGSAQWSGTVVAVFQPAEEQHNGAERMVADGLARTIPVPDVALGQHVMPGPADAVEIAEGPIMAASDDFRITLHGKGAHASVPHRGIDPVVMAASLVMRLQTVVSRHTDPEATAVVTVGRIDGGTKNNIIPEQAVIEGTVRSFDAEVSRCREVITQMARAEAVAHGAPEPHVEFYDQLPVTDNDPGTAQTVRAALTEEFGAERVTEMARRSGAEDFSVLPAAFGIPYAYWGFGAFDPEAWHACTDPEAEFPGNHSPQFAPLAEVSLRTGVRALTTAAWAWLGAR